MGYELESGYERLSPSLALCDVILKHEKLPPEWEWERIRGIAELSRKEYFEMLEWANK
jgi:hypothetical protein